MKNEIKATLIVIIATMMTLPTYAQQTDEPVEVINSGSFITSLNLGYLGAERDRNYNHEFEKSFKNLSYDLRLSYFLSNSIAISTSVSNIITSRNLFDANSDIGSFNISSSSVKLGLGAGYYHPLILNDTPTRLFVEGGVFRFSSSYEVSQYSGSINKSYTGYTMSTGLLVPLSSRLLLNFSLKNDIYPQEYIFGSTQNGIFNETRRDTKWNSEMNLNIGFSIKF